MRYNIFKLPFVQWNFRNYNKSETNTPFTHITLAGIPVYPNLESHEWQKQRFQLKMEHAQRPAPSSCSIKLLLSIIFTNADPVCITSTRTASVV